MARHIILMIALVKLRDTVPATPLRADSFAGAPPGFPSFCKSGRFAVSIATGA